MSSFASGFTAVAHTCGEYAVQPMCACSLASSKSPRVDVPTRAVASGPLASLTADGKVVGRHFAGPTWELADGSSVAGKPVANAPAAKPGDIERAWSLIDADGLVLGRLAVLLADRLRPLLDQPALARAAGLVAFVILALERRPAAAVARAVGITRSCMRVLHKRGQGMPGRSEAGPNSGAARSGDSGENASLPSSCSTASSSPRSKNTPRHLGQ